MLDAYFVSYLGHQLKAESLADHAREPLVHRSRSGLGCARDVSMPMLSQPISRGLDGKIGGSVLMHAGGM